MNKPLYHAVYRALLIGMVVSTALYALGVAAALWRPEVAAAASRPWTAALHAGFTRFDAQGLLLAATIVLILTPVSRVLVAMVTFWSLRDWKFVAITGAVLLVMALSVVLARLGLR